ncbi:MAG: sulfite exporter TauE/SafE family protein [Methanosarcinaceae archaeon]|nr:sulfite exporter TauE/SafE family protein [Methanosarcinaceae archaeon]
MTLPDPLYMVILFCTGAFTGLISGLLGVGGGFIMSPIQYWLFQAECGFSLPPTLAIRMAFGTSLAVIFPNAISGVLKHQKNSAVLWKEGLLMGSFATVASFSGAALATQLSAEFLSKIFGLVVILGALKTFKTPAVQSDKKKKLPNSLSEAALYACCGLLIGFLSGLVGIGGGVIAIPLMLVFLSFGMREAVGTSAAIMLFTSAGGLFGYILNGWKEPGLPSYSLGYVNLLNLGLLALPGMFAARLGAEFAHKVRPEALKCFFILLMLYVGLKMLGLF